jgi:hypothetical protein
MTRSRLFIAGLLSFVGCVALSVPAMAAEDSRMGGKNQGTQQEKEGFQQQRSDKTQQGQDMINKQPMSSQQSDKSKADCSSVTAVAGCNYPNEGKQGGQAKNTGADLSGGRDSHLGPHEGQDSQSSKKSMKGSGSSSDR